MPDYKTMYFELFNKVSDAISLLQTAQQKGEQSFIESEDTAISFLKNDETDKKE